MRTPSNIGRYEILEVIAEGPPRARYKARDIVLERIVAIETVDPPRPRQPQDDARLRQALRAKCELWRRLQHPNVLFVFDLVEHDGVVFLVLEDLEPRDGLTSLLGSGVPLSTGAVLKVARQVGAALDHAHARGVVHGDIRPANLLVTEDLTIRVTHFGLRPDGQLVARDEKALLEAAPYTSPEQAAGAPIDARSDVYSLGVCVYEMLFARHPFPAALRPGERLLPVFERVLARDPADRYAGAGEFVDALQRWIEKPTGAMSSVNARPSILASRPPEGTVLMPAPASARPIPAPVWPSLPQPTPPPPPPPLARPRVDHPPGMSVPPGSSPSVLGSIAEAVGVVAGGIAAIPVAAAAAVAGLARRLRRGRTVSEKARPAETPAPAADISGNPAHDPVDAAVYAPQGASPGESVLVQVFVHMPAETAVVTALARESDPDAERRGRKSLGTRVPRGARVGFDLHAPGLTVEDPLQTLVWNGRSESVTFGASVPATHPVGSVLCTVTATVDSVPVGHIKFKLSIERAGSVRERQPHTVADEVARYQHVFVSYASADRDKVLSRVQMLESLGIRYFQDVLSLDPGDRWQQQLYKHIDECDLFLLFWSSAAKGSEWVMKEVRYALARKAGDDLAPPEIKPVPIEGPPPVLPPPELAHLHFDDRVIYFMTRPS